MRRLAVAAFTSIWLVAPQADATSRIDGIEHTFGASNTNAVAGHGRLTVGVSPDGDLSVLSWPSPSFYDQLAYIASNDIDVRHQPHLGAHDGMGSYVGLLVEAGAGATLTWLRDPEWTHQQTYTKETAPVPITTFTRDDLGLTVVLTDIVSPDADVLTRRVQVTRAASSPVTGLSLAVYENLSPTLGMIEQIPVADWGLDSFNDFAALYDSTTGQILHFHPNDRHIFDAILDLGNDPAATDYGPVDALMRSAAPATAEVDQLVANLDSELPLGVAAVVTTDPPPTAFQVGSDATPICGAVDALVDNILSLTQRFPDMDLLLDPQVAEALRCTDPLPAIVAGRGWQWQPEDALADLSDGSLSGSPVAAGQTNGALIAPLSFTGDTAEGSVQIAFGTNLAEARVALGSVASQTAAERQAEAEAAADRILADVLLPSAELGERVRAVALRALVNVYVARDAGSGAIVASIARQPPYFLDWPRDGAFFSAGLDAAGIHDWVTQRFEWYTTLQRSEETRGNVLLNPDPQVPVDPETGVKAFPAGAWEMNYFANGVIGGPIRWEIDNTALHVWSLALHAAHLEGAERQSFVDAIWPSAETALELLARWREPETGLPYLANEDDNLALTSGLHAAVSVHAALIAGARLANFRGDEALARRYATVAAELRHASVEHYYDPDSGLWKRFRDRDPVRGSGTVAWLFWPGRLLPPDDPRIETQLDADMDEILSRLRGEKEGGSYTPKNIQSAALYGKDGGSRDKAREALKLLADVATPDTLHFGETYISETVDGELTWSNRVAPPHVWAGVLFYMASVSFDHGELFLLDETELPLPAGVEPWGGSSSDRHVEAKGEGCDCSVPHGSSDNLALLALAALGLAVGRRWWRPHSRRG